MLYLNPKIYSPTFVKNLQKTVEESLLSGVQLTEFISEGTQLQGVAAASIDEIVDAIDRYYDEINDTLVTETSTNFYVF